MTERRTYPELYMVPDQPRVWNDNVNLNSLLLNRAAEKRLRGGAQTGHAPEDGGIPKAGQFDHSLNPELERSGNAMTAIPLALALSLPFWIAVGILVWKWTR
jgi:hypothetical protein